MLVFQIFSHSTHQSWYHYHKKICNFQPPRPPVSVVLVPYMLTPCLCLVGWVVMNLLGHQCHCHPHAWSFIELSPSLRYSTIRPYPPDQPTHPPTWPTHLIYRSPTHPDNLPEPTDSLPKPIWPTYLTFLLTYLQFFSYCSDFNWGSFAILVMFFTSFIISLLW